jgi:hypothetical protein
MERFYSCKILILASVFGCQEKRHFLCKKLLKSPKIVFVTLVVKKSTNFYTKNAKISKNSDHNIDCQEKRQFLRKKLLKYQKSDRNIDPRMHRPVRAPWRASAGCSCRT